MLLCLALAAVAAWNAVRHSGAPRVLLGLAAALLAAGAIVLVILEGSLLGNVVVVVAFLASLASARTAFAVHVSLPRKEPPSHPVLLYNPRSGDGKAARFALADEAKRRGIESVELKPGDDLEQLVRAAVERGADGLAMAGGDGSQAIVAMIAAELDLPYACIPAGTRNHFALDLGVDREDVVGALDAFVNGGERRVDLAEVNGRVFVNNVSLGLYAEAVQRAGYREAKIRTLLDTVPEVMGPEAKPPVLTWSGQERAPFGGSDPRLQQPLPVGAAVEQWHASEAGHGSARNDRVHPARRQRSRPKVRWVGSSGPTPHSSSTRRPRLRPGSTARR